ncbi:DinB family protein [Marinobacter adhaerens]|uniref:DinB family protein n=1 Tax=Marinobacter adhaerens TaxID=1033846 RepID=UPI001C55D778|nr:DinB family protein [Marinobacter adhaerens]MBW3225125.1 DinB family protein [Marinobacter adhaerens]
MSLRTNFELMAAYNQWMNEKIYGAARGLEQTELAKDRGAFFGSILGTLNHIVVADTIWLKRFAMHPTFSIALKEVAELPSPNKLNDILFEDFAALSERRDWLDNHIICWVGTLSDDDLNVVLRYHNTKGVPANRRFSSLLQHFFNHQTHHRGQVSTLLSQAGVDIGVTDLLALIPDEALK